MNLFPLETFARLSVENTLNAIPAGFVIALFAWALLRLLRQNSGTRFAVWFVALVGIFSVPIVSAFGPTLSLAKFSSTIRFSKSLSTGSIGHDLFPSIHLPQTLAYLIFAVWIVGAFAGLLRLALGVRRMHEIRSGCTPLEIASLHPSVKTTVASITTTLNSAALFHARPKVNVVTSERAQVPSAIGLWQRTIVLPAWTVRELLANDLNAILLHEYAHLRRGDDWTNLIQKIVRALFFFHPAVWWIDARLSTEREMACDDAVLAETGNPHGYANCLVSLLERSVANRQWSMAQAAVHRACEASLRLAQILSRNRLTKTNVSMPAVGLVSLLSVLCLAAAMQLPQVISFESHSGNIDLARVPTSSSTPITEASIPSPEARVVPTRLFVSRTSEPEKSNNRATTRLTHKKPASPRSQVFSAAQTEFNKMSGARISAVRASNDQETAPPLETLMLVEASEYTNQDGPVVIQIWRMTVVRLALPVSGRIPAASVI